MFSNQLAKDWKYKWFGFWGSEEEYEGRRYEIEDYVDSSCPIEIRQTIVSYLDTATVVLAGQHERHKCALCDELLESASFRSDNVWLWTERLSHYVAKHDFWVPNAMVEHILLLDGIPPEKCEMSPESLPWP
jgi:hypothetical protein